MSGTRSGNKDCARTQTDLGAYALGALEPDEARLVEAHLATCADCRSELANYQLALGRLGTLVPPMEPPADLGERLMGAAAEPPVSVPVEVSSLEESHQFWSRSRWLALAAIACLLIAASLVALALLQNDDEDAPATVTADSGQTIASYVAAGAVSVPMTAQPKAVEWWPNGAGSLVLSEGKPALVVMSGCPPSSQYRDYRVWLAQGDDRTGVGSIVVNDEGIGVLALPDGSLAGDYDQIGVTMIDEDGERTDLMVRSLDNLPA